MRQVILVTFCSILSSVYGQDSTKKIQLGIDVSWGINIIGTGNYFPGITLSGNKHCVFAGPMIVYYADPGQRSPLIGLQAGYQVYPNGRKNRFNLFFEYDFNYLNAKITNEFSGPNSNPNGGVKRRTIAFYSLCNYLSYGFRLNIFKGLYFKTNGGVGLGWSQKDFIYEYWNGSVSENNKVPAYFAVGAILKVGFGYDFLTVKKG
jgi:hypothetical protein